MSLPFEMWEVAMRMTVVVDADLLQQAQQATGLKTKKEVIEAALQLMLYVHSQLDLKNWRGPAPCDEALDELWRSHLSGPPV